MDEYIAKLLNTYFNALSYTGYKSYDNVFKLLIVDFINELTTSVLRYSLEDEDIETMNDVLYQLIGSTCEFSIPDVECDCCGGSSSGGSTDTTTTTTPAPNTIYTYEYSIIEDPAVLNSLTAQEFVRKLTNDDFSVSFESGVIPVDSAGTSHGVTTTHNFVLVVPDEVYIVESGFNLDSVLPTVLYEDGTNVAYNELEGTVTIDGRVCRVYFYACLGTEIIFSTKYKLRT